MAQGAVLYSLYSLPLLTKELVLLTGGLDPGLVLSSGNFNKQLGSTNYFMTWVLIWTLVLVEFEDYISFLCSLPVSIELK